jgi:hypothetical protein
VFFIPILFYVFSLRVKYLLEVVKAGFYPKSRLKVFSLANTFAINILFIQHITNLAHFYSFGYNRSFLC